MIGLISIQFSRRDTEALHQIHFVRIKGALPLAIKFTFVLIPENIRSKGGQEICVWYFISD